MVAESQKYIVEFTAAFKQLAQAKPLTCAATQTDFPAVPAPTTVVIDVNIPSSLIVSGLLIVWQFILGQLIGIIHDINKDVKVHAFSSGMTGFTYLSFAPPERGGRGHFKADILREAERSGRPIAEVAGEVCNPYYHIYITMSYTIDQFA